LDIVAGNLGSINSIYFGDKDLNFKRVFDFKTERQTSSIKVADLNQDGYLDIVEGNSEERNYVHLGQKNGMFIEIGLREDLKDDTYNIEIGDLNNDELPDIVESNSGTLNLYYRTQKKKFGQQRLQIITWALPIWKIHGFPKVILYLEKFMLKHATAHIQTRSLIYNFLPYFQ
jgi:hypothetical protein